MLDKKRNADMIINRFCFLIFLISLLIESTCSAQIKELSFKEKTTLLNSLLFTKNHNPLGSQPFFFQIEQCATKHNLEKAFPLLNKTATLSGSFYLLNSLCRPLYSIETASKREEAITTLINDTTTRHQLLTLLKNLHENEQVALSFWHNYNDYTQRLIHESQYFTQSWMKKFNLNPTLLDIESMRTSVINPLLVICSPVISLACISLVISLYEKYTDNQEHINVGNLIQALYNIIIKPLQEDKEASTWSEKTTAIISLCSISGTYGYLVYRSLYYALLNHSIQKHIHSMTQALITCISTLSEIMTIIVEHPSLHILKNELVPLYAQINSNLPINKQENSDWPTYNTDALSTGEALALFKKIASYRENSSCLFHFIGICDAYVSMAQLYAEHADRKNSFCKVQFNQHFFETEQMWLIQNHEKTWTINPHDIAITQSADYNQFLLAQALALTLALNWGIAPAKSFFLPTECKELLEDLQSKINIPHPL